MENLVLKSMFFSFLSYKEDKIQDYIHEFFPNHTTHFIKSPDGSYFYGLVTDEKNNIAYLVKRGTDGDTKIGNLHSWLHDFNISVGNDGMHNGFQKLANESFDRFKDRLVNYKTVICCGHSQGAGTAQIDAKLCCENLSKDKKIKCIIFAAPPAGNKVFTNIMKSYIKTKQLEVTCIGMPGDPITSSLLRNPKIQMLDGSDIVDTTFLQDLIIFKIGPFDTVNHSCKMYCAGKLMQMAIDKTYSKEDFEFVGEIFKRCEN